ncbi:hypothetical protein ABT56_07140 [Photobacterium aquae]|uniref:Uncharacterized protein n=1 Tax=Photobacterium aquae TaxID=1195763 RepID=A0A0J1H5B6_9GAMM|nr:hypothetical protein [Photobacterium aquae]KLV06923.1 hypothetical protein ABT56_07140 [Photobacterium aquae]
MYIVIEHEITDPARFWRKADVAISEAPAGMRLCSTIVNDYQKCCQCMWQADSIDAIRDYLEPALGDVCNTLYGEVDPDKAIY